jgi:hypothetical protein
MIPRSTVLREPNQVGKRYQGVHILYPSISSLSDYPVNVTTPTMDCGGDSKNARNEKNHYSGKQTK